MPYNIEINYCTLYSKYILQYIFGIFFSQACNAVFFNKGENCIAAGRVFVEEGIYERFVERVAEEAGRMKISDPFDRSCDHGPQNHK